MFHVHIHLSLDDDTENDEVLELGPLSAEEALALQQEHQRFRADALYFDAHREELLNRYPAHWVAIYGEKVVGVAREHRDLLTHLTSSGVPVGGVYIQYAADDDVDLFLALA